jgi:quercetin dioxygenase-like cupin family protein
MEITYPHVIKNSTGETLTFTQVIQEADGDKVIGENSVMPGSGPPFHIHWLQDEGFTVVKGKIGYQLHGGPEQFATEGESVVFKRGEAHRFWNAGEEILQCSAWVKPAHNFVYFLSAIFAAQNKTGTNRPAMFDAAFLLRRYKSEFDMVDLPVFVKKVIMPVAYFFGKLLGKYKHFKDAPEPVKK